MVSFKKAAEAILKDSELPLTPKQILEKALEKELITSEGKTPEATMGAQIYTDIKTNKNTPFIKIEKGKFTVKNTKNKALDFFSSIDAHNANVKKQLLEKLLEMDPYQFESFVGELLDKIGYVNVETTKRSGDGGIDLKATLSLEGITNVDTVVQVKRWRNNVSGKTVTQLRGSAETGQRGLVIATSNFTKDAQKEAVAPNKIPISLINGDKLIKLLIKYSFGVERIDKNIYQLNSEYFNEPSTDKIRVEKLDKSRSIWPLPGGTTNYIQTLDKFLEFVATERKTKNTLINWFKETFETVQSDKSASGYVLVPKSMGLIDSRNGEYFLTEDGKNYLKSKNVGELYNTISKNIFGIEEILELLKTSNKPLVTDEILEYLNENYNAQWETFAQTNFRLKWLENLGKVVKKAEGYTLTKT